MLIIHELVRPQGPEPFQNLLGKPFRAYLPDYKIRRAWLKKNGQVLNG